MRWKVEKLHKNGDRRVRELFAWVPVRLDDDTKIWLDWYYVLEELTRSYWRVWWEVISTTKDRPNGKNR